MGISKYWKKTEVIGNSNMIFILKRQTNFFIYILQFTIENKDVFFFIY